jgi:hypothetical protein
VKQGARALIAAKAASIAQEAGGLQLLLDNPDDSEISVDEEAELRSIIALAQSAADKLMTLYNRA